MILVFSGPPGAGKSTLARAWAASRQKAVCIPVDDVRTWVVAGLADTLPEWTEETSRQFALAEDAVADLARRYDDAGFDVALDHCRVPPNIDTWLSRSGLEAIKVAVNPSLDIALARNAARTNKGFDTAELVPVIASVHAAYVAADLSGWIVLRNEDSIADSLAELSHGFSR